MVGFSRIASMSKRKRAEDQAELGDRDLSDPTHPDYDPALDPELQLRVVRTAAGSIHESIVEEDRRRGRRMRLSRRIRKEDRAPHGSSGLKRKISMFGRKRALSDVNSAENESELGGMLRLEFEKGRKTQQAAAEAEECARRQAVLDQQGPSEPTLRRSKKRKERRSVYVNIEGGQTNPDGYERNKVRTSKYTLLSFLPKNLMEQFRRVANLYFLMLVVLQVFPIFGAAAPQVAMLPLLAVLGITAIKDGIEDYRRHTLDNDVNNSAVTRLGDWNNVNKAQWRRPWYHFGFGSDPTGVSKGVRKLREKEGSYDAAFLYPQDDPAAQSSEILNGLTGNESSYTIEAPAYPPNASPNRSRSHTLASSNGRSTRSRSTQHADVVSYDHPTPGTARWERTLWKKLEVGDVVLLTEDDQIPADIVVLATSDAEDGMCFIETKNLDGETNLKPRKALKSTLKITNEEDLEHARFWIDVEAPHANLYSFNGVLKYRTGEEAPGKEHPVVEGRTRFESVEKEEPVTINELLLRGCALRNTKWVIGLVVFTGADTKIMLNQGETPSKRSKIEKETNFLVLVNFVILLALCVGSAVANGVYDGVARTSAQFFEQGADVSSINALSALVTFGACLILFQNIVPISLVITVELVKTIQAFFIFSDVELYYEPLDYPCVPKTWNISDDLGQIEYIFSDKTGTLTQNVMEFQKCAVNGIAYGEGITEAMLGAAKREGRDTSTSDPVANAGRLRDLKQSMISAMNRSFKNRYLQDDKLTFISPTFVQHLTTRSGEQHHHLVQFWRALALCHSVLADRPDPEQKPNVIEYRAESPDEAALVAAARDVGFVFLNRSNSEIEIEVMGQVERYVPLRMLEFNSARKRMSMIVRTPENKILLICKGADSVIYQRLRSDHDQTLLDSTSKNLEDFANAGLRTLCISSRYLTEEEFEQWARKYDRACAAVNEREEQIEQAAELIEKDLTILGATGLEDKLQQGVPEAIEKLHQAGIKLWILTGDKLQTAIEIGFSCNLLKNDMDILIISSETEEGARSQIEAGLQRVLRNGTASPNGEKLENAKTGGFAVVIDGETLRFALGMSIKPTFLDLTTRCDTVVCCRVSPSQKALTVKLVKDGKQAMTLAIGDGANDVAMIQEANIGIGIAGLEGAQAAMSADYAFGQFRFLTRLLIVHGRWCYIRVADMIVNFFLKNIIWTFCLFWFQIWCQFDSAYLFDYTLLMLFNLVFTSLGVAVLGIFDRDVSAQTALSFPQLYIRGVKGLEYTRTRFFAFMFDGLYQSAVCYFLPYFIFSMTTTWSVQGHAGALVDFGTTVAACAVTACNLYIGMHIRHWTWLVWVIIIGSILSFHVWIAIYSIFPTFTFRYEVIYLYSTLPFWVSLVLTQIACVGPKLTVLYIRANYYPTDADIVREIEIKQQSNGLSPVGMASQYRDIERDLKDDEFVRLESHQAEESKAFPVESVPYVYPSTPSTAMPSTFHTPGEVSPSVVSPSHHAAQSPDYYSLRATSPFEDAVTPVQSQHYLSSPPLQHYDRLGSSQGQHERQKSGMSDESFQSAPEQLPSPTIPSLDHAAASSVPTDVAGRPQRTTSMKRSHQQHQHHERQATTDTESIYGYAY